MTEFGDIINGYLINIYENNDRFNNFMEHVPNGVNIICEKEHKSDDPINGNMMHHIKYLQKIGLNKSNFGIIFEDDAVINESLFNENLEIIMNCDYDILLLGCVNIIKPVKYKNNLYKFDKFIGCHAICINKRIVTDLLIHMYFYDGPSDFAYSDFIIDNNLRAYIICPFPVTLQNNNYSTIKDTNFNDCDISNMVETAIINL